MEHDFKIQNNDVVDSPIPGLNLDSLLEYVIEECEDDEVIKFMNDCKRIEEDFSERKSLKGKTEILFKHFLKDCELVSKSKDLLITLDLIAGSRELTENNRILLECHGY